jgi:hypothetical protein
MEVKWLSSGSGRFTPVKELLARFGEEKISRIGIRPPERPCRSLGDIRTMPPQLFMLAVLSNDSGICTRFFFTVYSLLISSQYFN